MQKCSHIKQIKVIREEQICRSRNNAKEKSDSRVQHAIVCFYFVKLIIGNKWFLTCENEI